MVRSYILSGEKALGAQRLYKSDSIPRLHKLGYKSASKPSCTTIIHTVQRLLDYGQFKTPLHAKAAGGKRMAVEIEENIVDFVERNPRASTRDVARRFGTSQNSVLKILQGAGFHFRKIHDLKEVNAAPRRAFCKWLITHPDAAILWTDEALFTCVGLFTRHSEHWWSYRNRHNIEEHKNLENFSVNVWGGIVGNQVLGPYFIEGQLNGSTYLNMLHGVIADLMDDVPLALVYNRDFYYQHDGSPPYYTDAVCDYLNAEYGNQWIGHRGPVPWPPMSPDLAPCKFFLWGEVRRLVYAQEIQNLNDLKVKISSAFDKVRRKPVVLRKLKDDMQKRARLCLEKKGFYFEHLLL